MKQGRQTFYLSSRWFAVKTSSIMKYGFVLLFMFMGFIEASAQLPVITVRFANPVYDCANGEYCVDVEFQSDTPGQELFGMNVRFFYDEDILEFVDFRDFQGGYGAVSPNPPFINTGNANSGPDLFNYVGPAEFINGAVQLVDNNATAIPISTTDWTKLYSVCFTIDDPSADLDNFCPSLTWDLEVDPANGGFLTGDDGVVITVVNPDPNLDSAPSTENVVQYNWEYSGPGTAPYGMPLESECIQIRCIDLSLDKVVDNGTPMIGDNIVFTVTVSNAGPDEATLVEVVDQLPDGYLYVSDDSGGDYDEVTGVWDVGTIAASGSAVLNITATVQPPGDYLNLAEVTSANGIDDDSTPGNGADTDGDGNVGIDDDPDDEDDGDDAIITPIFAPDIQLYKTITSVSGTGGVGDVITYGFTVTNTGDVILTNVMVTDPLVSVVGGPLASLAPGASDNTTFTATYMITQADVDAGYVENTATATGSDPDGVPVTDTSDAGDDTVETPDGDGNTNGDPADDPTVQPINQNPAIQLYKTITSVSGTGGVGDVITYGFTVTNTGDVTLTNVMVTDPLVTVVGGPLASLAPGASDNATFTATYMITQADVDAGYVENTAMATGSDPDGAPVTDTSDAGDDTVETPDGDGNTNGDPADDPTVQPLNQDPAIQLYKTITSVSGTGGVGDVITYGFTVTNTGDVTLTNVMVTDPLVTVVGGPLASLAPGASDNTTFTATYMITQSDVDAGYVENTAMATGSDPDGVPVTDTSDAGDDTVETPDGDGNTNGDPADDPTVQPLNQNPAIQLYKTITSVSGTGGVGDVITYGFTVTNTGDVTLTNVMVTDPLVSVVGGPLASLAPGASDNTTFTATYMITQSDVDAGYVENTATATGSDPDGVPVTDTSDAGDDTAETPDGDGNTNGDPTDDPTVQPLNQNPAIQLYKTIASVSGTGGVGDVITYGFTVTNTGDVTLTNVMVADPLVTVVGGPLASLAPGASDNTTFTATYMITQSDVDAGYVENTATATGSDPDGVPVTDTSDAGDDTVETPDGDGNTNSDPTDDPTVQPINQDPELQVDKTDVFNDENADGFAQIGETITYTITVTNTGNVTIDNIMVVDPAPGADIGSLSCTIPANLAPGEDFTCTATHTITQADLDAGSVSNQATATGDDPNDNMVSDLSDDPDDSTDVDSEGDGEGDDPTLTPLNVPAFVFGHLYLDTNGNGMQDASEPDLANVDVVVTDVDGDMFTVTTDANGDWSIFVDPGSTTVDVDEGDPDYPTGYTQTEGDDPTTISAPAAMNTDAGNDGYYLPATVSGHLYEDTNGNGMQDAGEPDLANIDMIITYSEGNMQTVTTDASGDWSASVPPGTTMADVDETDPDYPTGSTQTEGDDPTTVTAVAGTDTDAGDDGYYLAAIVSGHLYLDTNGNGMQDAGEPDLTNVDVIITDSEGNMQTVATDANGDWTASVPPGITMADVDEADPEYPTGSSQTEGDDPTTVTAVAGIDTDAGNDGYFFPATVSGHLYEDTNGNGMQDAGEPDLANVDVIITDSEGNMQTVTTDANGDWSASVPPGSTTADVDEADPEYPTGSSQTEGDDPTTVIAVADMDTDTGNDGYYLPATVSGHLYEDTNGNGVQDAGEPDLANVDVIITDNEGNMQTVPTDANGDWTASVPPGNTTADVDEADPDYPTGYTQTEGNDPTTVTAVAGIDADAGNDGYYLPATVSGHLYEDTNGNGMQDAGEPDLANVDVIITDSEGNMQTVTTDANGDWSASVPPGTTMADVDETDPDYPTGSTQTEGDDPTTVTTIAGMDTDAGNDGYFFPGFITGHLYEDTNGNGTQDAGEPDLANIDVIITDSEGNMQTVTTDANGNWGAVVPPGTTIADVDETDPDYPTGHTQTEGDDPTTFTAVAGMTISGGIDGYQPCLTIEAWVYLEGSAIDETGQPIYSVPMRRNLNNLRVLPGQVYVDPFFGTVYSPAGQPYNVAPWNYNGQEGAEFDSGGDMAFADAAYPATVTDWVLVSLRDTPDGSGGAICQAAALLHEDGTIEFVDAFSCCSVDLTQSYYLVIEHRNHLIVMSHEPVDIVNGKLTYDFRIQESYVDDPFGFGTFVGQKEVLPGVFTMYAGNGNQTDTGTSDTDINFDDRTYWESENGILGDYRIGDYNMNGDTNFNDRTTWENNNGSFTSVPRD